MVTVEMFKYLVFLAIAVGVLYYFIKKNNTKTYDDVAIPMPETLRTDLLYGYYSSLEDTYEQVKGHVNLFWYTHFFSVEKFIEILKDSDAKIVVDLLPYLFERTSDKKIRYQVKADAEESLRGFFGQLKMNGVLSRISFLTTNDEPNIFCKDAAEHLKAIEIVKKVRAEFSDLNNAKLLVIYAADGNWINIEQFDVVGVDHYEQKSYSLTQGSHAGLVAALKPGQKTILIPGPAFGHDPQPWLAYAHTNVNEVLGIVPFLWFDDPAHKDVDYTGLQAASVDFRAKWIEAGLQCAVTRH